MLFNSYGFIFLFLPIVLLGFFQLARFSHAYAAGWLCVTSLFFYGYWNPAYIGLLLGSIACNYAFGLWIVKAGIRQDEAHKKHLLYIAIFSNLLILGYYKYTHFLLSSISSLTDTHLVFAEIILPLGISFFTFTQIAFLVDTYQGKVKEYNFIHYTLFVTFFPHLIAGPVLHHKEMMPQFARTSTYHINWSNIATGLMLFTLGLCKKTQLADTLAPYASGVFNGVQLGIVTGILPTTYEAWAGALAYTLQIYFDFSGYTDMALGIALMFGIRLPDNFNSPYKATSIIEFWRRWHMTLSRFLRDYLYIPLGGNRNGNAQRYLNLCATMLLGGLWHGAGWTFVLWGALHGAYLTINHLWREAFPERVFRWIPSWMATLAGSALTFIAVVTAWVLFRSGDITQALTILKAMYGIEARDIAFDAILNGQLLPIAHLSEQYSDKELYKWLLIALAWIWLLPNSSRLKFIEGTYTLAIAQASAVIYLLYLAIEKFGNYSPFLYFQF